MKKTLCLLLTLLMLVPVLSSCNTPDKPGGPGGESPATIHTTNVIRVGGIQEYGPYVLTGWYNKIIKYSIPTNTNVRACNDPMCEGCALEGQIIAGGIVDGKLYFRTQDVRGTPFEAYTYYTEYDLITGETNVLGYWKTPTVLDGPIGCYIWEDYLYYWILDRSEEGIESSSAADYAGYVYRVPLTGGEHEKIYELETGEAVLYVVDGYIITTWNGDLYKTDLQTLTKEKFFSLEESSYRLLLESEYLDGKMYVRASTTEFFFNEYTNQKRYKSYLISIDIHSGDVKRVVNGPVIDFTVTDEGIYYCPQALIYLYVPEDYKEHPEEVVVYLGDHTLHYCKHDGSEDKIVYQNDKLSLGGDYTIIDNVYYGIAQDYLEEEHRFNYQAYFAAIDLATGEIKVPPKLSEK